MYNETSVNVRSGSKAEIASAVGKVRLRQKAAHWPPSYEDPVTHFRIGPRLTSVHVADKLGVQRVDPGPYKCRSTDGDTRSHS